MTKTLTEQLGEFVAQTKFTELPAEVVERAKTCLLHNLGVAMAGRRAEPTVHALVARRYATPPESTLFWDGSKVSAEGAALANAALMHARTQDDTHFPSSTHTGATVIPAALAVAEAEGRSGEEFLTAMALGYEVAGRIGREYDTITTPKGFRATPLYGGFGAAAAAARLMRLGPEQVAVALGFAANLAGGLGQTWIEGSSEWRVHVGIAGRNGIFAARIAAAGASAARESLEGVAGFYRAFGGTVDHAAAAVADLGKAWVLPQVTLKPYPVCAIQQSPVTMMIDLATTHDLKPADVAEIVLELNPYEAAYPGTDAVGPFTDQGATLMSGQFCIALALADRTAKLDGLFRFDDPVLRALTHRVRIVADPSVLPLSSRLIVRTVDGRVLERETMATPRLHKFSFEEDAALVRGLVPEMGVAGERAERLIATLREIDTRPSVVDLLAVVAGQG
jgi:2-methylcitrate dehydratase PrpD